MRLKDLNELESMCNDAQLARDMAKVTQIYPLLCHPLFNLYVCVYAHFLIQLAMYVYVCMCV